MSIFRRSIVPTVLIALLGMQCAAAEAPVDGVRLVSASEYTACAVRSDGALFCWGRNDHGQAGSGHASDKEPHPVEVIAKNVSAVSVGFAHACAIVEGVLSCWGWNKLGQVDARHPGADVLAPLQVLAHGVTAVAAGGMHTCAVVAGALYCWGNNLFGAIGNGVHGGHVSEAFRVFDSGVTAVSAQAQDTCAIVHGALWCWGDNRFGQVGSGPPDAMIDRPVKVIERDVSAVAVGHSYACAVVAHAAQCWGAIRAGRMGESAKAVDRTATPTVVIGAGVSAIAAGTSHACAIVNGALQCWGYSAEGNIRRGNAGIVDAPLTIVPAGVTSIAAGNSLTCAIVNDALRCRGYDGYGSALTDGGSPYAAFATTAGDVRALNHAAADAAAAQARLPGEVAAWLEGKRVTDGKAVYVVTHAKLDAPPNRHTDTALDVVPLYALQFAQPGQDDRNDTTPIEATLPTGAVCGEGIDQIARLQSGPIAVLRDNAFVALNEATDGVYARLPALNYGIVSAHPLRLDAADLHAVDTCAAALLARIDRQPLAGIDLYVDAKPFHLPATPGTESLYPRMAHEMPSKIVIERRTGAAADYTIDARVTSSMRCGELTLWNWEHGQSIAWQLSRSKDTFDVRREPLDTEAPTFPAFTKAQLRAAIDEGRREWNIETPIDESTCSEVLSGETYSIRKGNELLREIYVQRREPIPALPLDCEGDPASLAVHVASDLGYPMSMWNDNHALCKAWPGRPDTRIVALAYQQPETGDADEPASGDYDLSVALVDTKTRRVFARLRQPAAYTSDAWRFEDIAIDSGRYTLGPGVRAFGVRATSGGSSHVSTAEDTTLNLYVWQGAQLREVVSGLLVRSIRGESDGQCTGDGQTLERTIDIAPTRHHGLADLIVTSTTTASKERVANDDCASDESPPAITRETLRYDGKAYVVASALMHFPSDP